MQHHIPPKPRRLLPLALALALTAGTLVPGASAAEACDPESCGHTPLGAAKTAEKTDGPNGYTVTLRVPGKEDGHNEYLVMFDASISITDHVPQNWTSTVELVNDIGSQVLAETDTTNVMRLMTYAISAGTRATLHNRQELQALDLDSGRFRYGISATNCEASLRYMEDFIQNASADTRLSSVIWLSDGGANYSEYPAPLQNWVDNPGWSMQRDAEATALYGLRALFLPRLLVGEDMDPVTAQFFSLEELLAGCLTPNKAEEALAAAPEEEAAGWQAILARFDGEGCYLWDGTTAEEAALIRGAVTDEELLDYACGEYALTPLPGPELRTGAEGDFPRWRLWNDRLWAAVYEMAGWSYDAGAEVSWGDLQTAFINFDEEYYGADGFDRSTFAAAEYQLYCVMRCPLTQRDCTLRAAEALRDLCAITDVTVVHFNNSSRGGWLTEEGWASTLGLTGEGDLRPFTYIGVPEYTGIPGKLQEILTSADAGSCNDACITDYMSKWVHFQEGSVRIYDDREDRLIYDDAQGGWLVEDPPVSGRPYQLLTVETDGEGGEAAAGNISGSIQKLVWKIKDGALRRSDIYRLEYGVTVDTEEAGFQWNTDYPANGHTTVTYTDPEGTEHTEPIAVPTVAAPGHTVTVNYYDQSGERIAQEYVSGPMGEGTAYDVTERDRIPIGGYTYDRTEGDPLTGVLDEDKVIDVYYDRRSGGGGGGSSREPDDDGDDDVLLPGGGGGTPSAGEEAPETPAAPEPGGEAVPEQPAADPPMAEVPATGDTSALWLIPGLASALGLAALRKRGKG